MLAGHEVTKKIQNDSCMGRTACHENVEDGDLEDLEFVVKCCDKYRIFAPYSAL